jgi:hypothetical protein
MTSRLRVAHFGTGHTGTQVRRQILQRPDLELVGHLVHSPEKVDSGEIAEFGPLGVSAIADVDEVIDHTARQLESGKNVVPSAGLPTAALAHILGQLEKFCGNRGHAGGEA